MLEIQRCGSSSIYLAESMSNLASSASGASVPLATSNDDKYPPEALIDGYVQKACEKHAKSA